jgi:hypothetical protein
MVYGYGLGAVTTVDGLTPALPKPNGMLVRATPPGYADDVATDDKALLLKAVPHSTLRFRRAATFSFPHPSQRVGEICVQVRGGAYRAPPVRRRRSCSIRIFPMTDSQ